MKIWAITVSVLLAGAVGAGVFFYIDLSGDVDTANAEIATLEGDKATLEENITDLETDLADTEATLADTETELADTEAELATTEADLSDANSQISSLQSSLTLKTTQLNSEKARTTSLQGELNTVMYPRHFNSVQELADWLQQDDTNTLEDIEPANWSFILQVRALQDGYILPVTVAIDFGTQTVYWANFAVIADEIYFVYADGDTLDWICYISPIPSCPIPQGQ